MKKFISLLLVLDSVVCVAPAYAESSWIAPTPIGSELVTGTSFYLYNVGADAYLTNITGLTTTAGFGSYSRALSCTLVAITGGTHDGKYIIEDSYASGEFLYESGTYLYVDGGSGFSTDYSAMYFNFTPVDGETNVYTICCDSPQDGFDSRILIGYDGTSTYINCNFSSTTTGANVQWKLVASDNAEIYEAMSTLYSFLVEAESMGMTDSNEAYKTAGDAYTSDSPSAETMIKAATVLEEAILAYSTQENAVDESSWIAPTPMGSELATGTSFFLYNVGADAYLTNVTVRWTTTAGFGSYSDALSCMLVTITGGTHDGSYIIEDSYASGEFLFAGDSYLYVDGGSNNMTDYSGMYFYFTPVDGETYVYTIYCNGPQDHLGSSTRIGYDGTNTYIARSLPSTTTGANVQWKLVTSDDAEIYEAMGTLYSFLVEAESMGMTDSNEAYKTAGDAYTSDSPSAETLIKAAAALKEAILVYGIPENAVDVTDDYIVDPNFSDVNAEGAWIIVEASALSSSNDSENGHTWWLQDSITYVNGTASLTPWFAESWRDTSWNPNTISDGGVQQILTLPAGKYILKADVVASWQGDGGTEPAGVFLFAGSEQVAVKTVHGKPETYSVEFIVESDDTQVTIGLKVEDTNVNWAGVDNFKLYYEGKETGTNAVEATSTPDNVVYDLSGRKVSNAQRGIYIKGGKKVFFK
ncbi:MAG: hypothetical protein LUI09_02700 [Prevotellaceae bacterium]|nr:hypothetical protein [Prevotellaceae bacterium]